MPPLDLAIHGGTIVTATETRRADIGIADGRIVAIGEVGEALVEEDATGLLVLPGVVDPHTHLEAQFRAGGATTADDFLSGTEAAACGGVTTIIDYARQFPGATLMDGIREGMKLRKRVGLISAATSDHPQLEKLLEQRYKAILK